MVRLIALSLLLASFGTGCCHCYQRTWYPGRGPVAAALARPARALACNGGCSEVYWGEWNSDPPDDYDPCCGDQWVGPRYGNSCCGQPHARLCIWNLLAQVPGVRGSCLGYCCDGCGQGCCDGSCGGGYSGGAEWSDGAVEYSDGYAPGGDAEQYYSPTEAQPEPTPAVPEQMQMGPQGRTLYRSRSASHKRYARPPVRSVSHEEELTAQVATSSSPRPEPALMENVLPDPRSAYRR